SAGAHTPPQCGRRSLYHILPHTHNTSLTVGVPLSEWQCPAFQPQHKELFPWTGYSIAVSMTISLHCFRLREPTLVVPLIEKHIRNMEWTATGMFFSSASGWVLLHRSCTWVSSVS